MPIEFNSLKIGFLKRRHGHDRASDYPQTDSAHGGIEFVSPDAKQEGDRVLHARYGPPPGGEVDVTNESSTYRPQEEPDEDAPQAPSGKSTPHSTANVQKIKQSPRNSPPTQAERRRAEEQAARISYSVRQSLEVRKNAKWVQRVINQIWGPSRTVSEESLRQTRQKLYPELGDQIARGDIRISLPSRPHRQLPPPRDSQPSHPTRPDSGGLREDDSYEYDEGWRGPTRRLSKPPSGPTVSGQLFYRDQPRSHPSRPARQEEEPYTSEDFTGHSRQIARSAGQEEEEETIYVGGARRRRIQQEEDATFWQRICSSRIGRRDLLYIIGGGVVIGGGCGLAVGIPAYKIHLENESQQPVSLNELSGGVTDGHGHFIFALNNYRPNAPAPSITQDYMYNRLASWGTEYSQFANNLYDSTTAHDIDPTLGLAWWEQEFNARQQGSDIPSLFPLPDTSGKLDKPTGVKGIEEAYTKIAEILNSKPPVITLDGLVPRLMPDLKSDQVRADVKLLTENIAKYYAGLGEYQYLQKEQTTSFTRRNFLRGQVS